MGSVVDDPARTLIRSSLEKEDTHPFPLAGNEAGIHSEPAQLGDGRVSDRIQGEGSHKGDIDPIVCERDGCVGFGSREGRRKGWGL
jgi:hypothetical protein